MGSGISAASRTNTNRYSASLPPPRFIDQPDSGNYLPNSDSGWLGRPRLSGNELTASPQTSKVKTARRLNHHGHNR